MEIKLVPFWGVRALGAVDLRGRDPNLMNAYIGPKVCQHYLHCTIWIPRVVGTPNNDIDNPFYTEKAWSMS